MTVQKIFFGKNIKMLREQKKMTQEALASQLGMTRKKLFALESGQTKTPPATDMINIARFFEHSIDTLLTVDLTKLSPEEILDHQTDNTQFRVLAISVNSDQSENIEYVPVKAKAGYAASYHDPEFIAALPKCTFPNLPKGHTYRVFPTTGDSMLPIPAGSEVIAQYVADWKTIKPETPCIVILKGDQDFVFKLVTLQKGGRILLRSLNEVFQPYTVQMDEVAEIWKYHKHQTDSLPDRPTDLQEIKGLLVQLLGQSAIFEKK